MEEATDTVAKEFEEKKKSEKKGPQEDAGRDTEVKAYQNLWQDFCESTTMHGWLFVADNHLGLEGKLGRAANVVWFLVIVAMSFTAATLIALIIKDQRVFQIASTYQLKPINELDIMHFPSVALCNLNQARRSALQATTGLDIGNPSLTPFLDFTFRGQDHDDVPELVGKVLGSGEMARFTKLEALKIYMWYKNGGVGDETLFDYINANHPRSRIKIDIDAYEDSLDLYRLSVLQRLSQSIFLAAKYNGITANVGDDFGHLHPFFDTDYGFCTYVRPQIMFDFWYQRLNHSYEQLLDYLRYPIVPGEIGFGRKAGFKLLMDLETFDYGESSSYSDGIQITLQYPTDFPVMKIPTLDVRPGYDTTVALAPKVQDTTLQAINRFTIEERNCVAEEERFMNVMSPDKFRYSFDNCLVESVFQAVDKDCLCNRAMGNLRVPLKGENVTIEEGCYGKKLKCYKDTWNNLGESPEITDKYNETNECLDACKTISYPISHVAEAKFPSFNAIQDDPKLFCLAFRKLYAICKFVDSTYQARYGANDYELKRAENLESYFKYKYGDAPFRKATINCIRQDLASSDNKTKPNDLSNYPVCYLINIDKRKHGVCLYYNHSSPILIDEMEHNADRDLRDLRDDFANRDITFTCDPKPEVLDWCNLQCSSLESCDCTNHVKVSLTDSGYKISTSQHVRELVFNYSRDNMAAITLMMGDLSVRLSTRDERKPLIWIVSDFGGVLGFSTGISLITLVEFLYFCCKFFIFWRWRSKEEALKRGRVSTYERRYSRIFHFSHYDRHID